MCVRSCSLHTVQEPEDMSTGYHNNMIDCLGYHGAPNAQWFWLSVLLCESCVVIATAVSVCHDCGYFPLLLGSVLFLAVCGLVLIFPQRDTSQRCASFSGHFRSCRDDCCFHGHNVVCDTGVLFEPLDVLGSVDFDLTVACVTDNRTLDVLIGSGEVSDLLWSDSYRFAIDIGFVADLDGQLAAEPVEEICK